MSRAGDIKEQIEFDGSKSDQSKSSYQHVMKVLDKDLEFDLGFNFADSVMNKLKAMDQRRRTWLILFSALGVVSMIAVSTITYLVSFGVDELLKFKDVTSWAVFAGLALVTIQYFDAKLVKKRNLTMT